MKGISDSWLHSKQGREKGFSVGSFDPAYLTLNPMALVRREGQIVGFANLWTSDNKESLSIDLMRYSLDTGAAPVMDFLFVELLLWGKQEGYASFNLGMAPMSGFNDNPWAVTGPALATPCSPGAAVSTTSRDCGVTRRSSAQGGSPATCSVPVIWCCPGP